MRPENNYLNYHAHVYFGADTVEFARNLCHQAGELFNTTVGRVHERPVGPHPMWSCLLTFDSNEFDQIIPWLDEHRNGLTVLVHGDTGDHLADHTTHAAWLGDSVELNLSQFMK